MSGSVDVTAPREPRLVQVIYRVLGGLAAIVLFLLMAITFVDVVGRYFFGAPLPGTFELSQLGLGIAVFAALPVVSGRDQHILVDFTDDWFSGIGRRMQRWIVALVSSVLLGLITWRLWLKAAELADYGDATTYLAIPMAPIAYFMSVACALSTVSILLCAGMADGTSKGEC